MEPIQNQAIAQIIVDRRQQPSMLLPPSKDGYAMRRANSIRGRITVLFERGLRSLWWLKGPKLTSPHLAPDTHTRMMDQAFRALQQHGRTNLEDRQAVMEAIEVIADVKKNWNLLAAIRLQLIQS